MPESHRPTRVVCLTIGDPTGIGPEITAKFLRDLAINHSKHSSMQVYGDIDHLFATAEQLQIELPQASDVLRFIDVAKRGLGSHHKLPGEIADESLILATEDIRRGQGHVLVTGPISKSHLEAAKIPFSGHTEILQHQAAKLYPRNADQSDYQADMLFVYREFRMLLLTRHVALRKVSETLSIDEISQSLENLIVFFREAYGLQNPRLCILGVNPHAGEIDGDEEERLLKPALRQVSAKFGFEIPSPIAADAAFRHFDIERLNYDAFVAAYHDQGLIPFKMVAGLNAVNVTIGLPFLRTSVSHGTAEDIVGQGIADSCSLHAAYDTALQLTEKAFSPLNLAVSSTV